MIKRILLIAFTLMLSITIKANNLNNTLDSVKTTVQSILPDSSQLSFKEVYTDIKAGLSGLGSALKVGSEHVYEVLIKQQIVYGILYSIIFLLGIILTSIGIRMFHKSKTSDWEAPTILILSILCFWVGGLTLLGIGIGHIDNITTGFINPEYGAIKDILEFIK